ncbi:tyrosine-type recombinase/integrase [Mesorhizobium sp. IMUNJ 23232]|uniref:tyrosine-type recombinase/integrase n=1 Tax=Mesorhizobium sp. IMUNJ 23232 TaxID=3376064 RepID=UPI0037AD7C8E
MRRRPAKILRPGELRTLLKAAGRARHPERNTVIVLLSVRAGLRACEIASLEWGMVLTPKRQINHVIELPDWAAKKGSGRRVPVHRELKVALARLAATEGQDGPIVVSERGRSMTARTIVNWFARMYALCDLAGCSSHSGRRTFITNAARLVYRAGGSLRDVQQLAGHQSLKTTQAYIDGDTDAQRRLVRLL